MALLWARTLQPSMQPSRYKSREKSENRHTYIADIIHVLITLL